MNYFDSSSKSASRSLMMSSEFIGTGRYSNGMNFSCLIFFCSQTNLILSAWLNSNKDPVVSFSFIHSISKVHFTSRWWIWSSRVHCFPSKTWKLFFWLWHQWKNFLSRNLVAKFSRSDLNEGSLIIMNGTCVAKSNFKQSQSYLFQLATEIFVNLNSK